MVKEQDSGGHFKDINLFPPLKGWGVVWVELWIPLREAHNHLVEWFHSHPRKLHMVICKWDSDYINVSKFDCGFLRKTILQYRPTQHSAWQPAVIRGNYAGKTRELLFWPVPITGQPGFLLNVSYWEIMMQRQTNNVRTFTDCIFM